MTPNGYHQAMADLLTLLVLVLALAAGLVTATVSAMLVHSRKTMFFRYFLAHILLFNLLILAGLVFRYAGLHPPEEGSAGFSMFVLTLLVVMAALKLAWLYAFASMNLALPGADKGTSRRRRVWEAGGAAFLVYLGLLVMGEGYGPPIVSDAANVLLEILVIGGALLSSAHLLSRVRSDVPARRRRAVAVFACFHLVLFAGLSVMLVFGWLGGTGQGSAQVLFNSALLVVFNLFPLGWILRFQPLGPSSLAGNLDRYGITPREREIIELIRDGSTNQEIADRLFISLATVKDHNHNIFRKTGVRNRVELANLFRERCEPGER